MAPTWAQQQVVSTAGLCLMRAFEEQMGWEDLGPFLSLGEVLRDRAAGRDCSEVPDWSLL